MVHPPASFPRQPNQFHPSRHRTDEKLRTTNIIEIPALLGESFALQQYSRKQGLRSHGKNEITEITEEKAAATAVGLVDDRSIIIIVAKGTTEKEEDLADTCKERSTVGRIHQASVDFERKPYVTDHFGSSD
jgi:hypothetical protein